MAAYYNEFDAGAAAWLRELINRGLIADGIVDERSILDVQADDLREFTQCHFFAGIGGWSYALRLAGWPDDRQVWTGSPPCQPFSSAGQQKGQNDERHLAPHWATLIAAVRPAIIFGEQVASAAVFGKSAKRAGSGADAETEWAWIDDLFGRLEAAHYACGASDLPAAGIGAPHIRQRTFFGAVRLADANRERHDRIDALLWKEQGNSLEAARRSEASGLADTASEGLEGQCNAGSTGPREDGARRVGISATDCCSGGMADAGHMSRRDWAKPDGPQQHEAARRSNGAGGLGNASGARSAAWLPEQMEWQGRVANEHDHRVRGLSGPGAGKSEFGGLADADNCGHGVTGTVDGSGKGKPWEAIASDVGNDGRLANAEGKGSSHRGSGAVQPIAAVSGRAADRPRPPHGGWQDADWLFCRDGKWRPVEPGTFPLAHGIPARVGRLRGYGNAIVPQAAATFIQSMMEIL